MLDLGDVNRLNIRVTDSTGTLTNSTVTLNITLPDQTTVGPFTPTNDSTGVSVQNDQPSRSSSRTTTSSECLICQLHHNLATTLLSEPATVTSLDVNPAHFSTAAHGYLREITTAQSGRAPPLSFLS